VNGIQLDTTQNAQKKKKHAAKVLKNELRKGPTKRLKLPSLTGGSSFPFWAGKKKDRGKNSGQRGLDKKTDRGHMTTEAQ